MESSFGATAGDFNIRSNNGWTADFWVAGSMTYTLAILVANFKIFIFSYSHCFLTMFSIFGGIGYYLGNVAVLDGIPNSDLYDTLTQ